MRWIKDPNLAAQGLACNVNTGGPGCFPDNRIPANRINADRPADAEPVPDAERDRSVRQPAVQLHLPERARQAAQRPGDACRLQRQPGHDLLHPRAVRERSELARCECVPRRRHRQRWQRRVAAVQHLLRGRLGQHGQHAAAHLQRDDGRRGDDRPELGGTAGESRVAGRARPERSPRRARRAGPVLPERQPAVPRAADQLRRHQRAAEHPRRRRGRSLSVQRQQHHLELLGEPVEDCRPAQPQDGRLLRAHGPSGAARGGVQRQLQLRRQRQQPVRHQPRVRERAARIDQQLHGIDGQAVRRGPVQPGRVLRAGQLAHHVAADARLRGALLLHRPDVCGGSGRLVLRRQPVGIAGGTAPLPAGLPEQRGDLHRQRPAGAESAHRPDPQQHLHRQAGAELRRLLRRHGRHPGDGLRRQGTAPGAAPRLRVGRVRRRQDVGSWRLGHLLRPLSGRHHPVARRAAAAHGHADDELHDDSAICRTRSSSRARAG